MRDLDMRASALFGLVRWSIKAYPEFEMDDEKLLETLGDAGIIKRNNDFKEGGFDKLKATYPKAFGSSLKAGKVKTGGKTKHTASIRLGKYDELKSLWEAINQKVVLESSWIKTTTLRRFSKVICLSRAISL